MQHNLLACHVATRMKQPFKERLLMLGMERGLRCRPKLSQHFRYRFHTWEAHVPSLVCDDVRSLGSQNMSLRAEGATALSVALPLCPRLRTLHLRSNGIGDRGARALSAGLVFCGELRVLSLGSNRIGPEGARHLARALRNCRHVNWVSLLSNRLRDKGAKALATQWLNHGCPSLQFLNLDSNEIGQEGAAALGTALAKHCPRVETLGFGDNDFKVRNGTKAQGVGRRGPLC